ncbi:MAG: hypothetical protein ACOZNI_15755 [Myxococcota bacterium]
MLLSLTAAAFAATCDTHLAKIGGLAPEAVAPAFTELAKCDKKVADANFNRYLEKATDTEAVSALFAAAVDADVWNPVWGALSKITSYEARDEIAGTLGASCTEKPKVVSFLQGAYLGLRDVDFATWSDAYAACNADPLWIWMDGVVRKPPTKSFDEKYDALLGLYVKKQRADALPALTEAAIAAGSGSGPFDAIVEKMGAAVAPELGSRVSEADKAKLEEALVQVAQKVPPPKAHRVASQLSKSGSDAAAAKLLPVVYPDRVQGGGGFLYGALGVEAADCGGKKQAVLHYATVTEPGKRWSIQRDVEPMLRAAKPKLGKECQVHGDWPVLTTPEPLKASGDGEAWVESVQADWEKNGYAVKVQKEKGVTLP